MHQRLGFTGFPFVLTDSRMDIPGKDWLQGTEKAVYLLLNKCLEAFRGDSIRRKKCKRLLQILSAPAESRIIL